MKYMILIIVFIILLLTIYYNTRSICKLSFTDKLKVPKILKIVIILFIFSLFVFLFDVYNYVIVMLHLSIFILISNLILVIIEKIKKKEIKKNNLKVYIGLIITVLYLGIGYYINHNIVETKYTVYTEKDVNLKIIMFADSHVGTTFDGEGFSKKMEELSKIDSDLVFIVGDYIDDDTSYDDMVKACRGLSKLKPKYGVYYVFGNHDRGYFNNRGYSSDDLIGELEKNNVHVLVDEIVEFNNFYIIGREDRGRNRKSIDELVSNLDNKYKIVLNHQPNDYDNEKNKVDLVLSGHTHGGQMLPLGLIGTFFGNNQEYGIETIDNTTFIVTSGISGWAVQFKTGAKSEYVIIDIKNN